MFTFIPIVIPQHYYSGYICDGFFCYVYYLLNFVIFFVFLSFLSCVFKK